MPGNRCAGQLRQPFDVWALLVHALNTWHASTCSCLRALSPGAAQEWIDDMAAFVKGIDPNHLVSVGLMGWYGASTPERCALSPALYPTP